MNIARIAVRMTSSPWLWAVAVLGLLLLAAASLLPADRSPPRTVLPGPVEHFLAYAVVSAVAAFAFVNSARLWLLGFALIGYAAVLELAQHWASGRSPNMMDFAASSAGAVTGIALCGVVLRLLAKFDPSEDRS